MVHNLALAPTFMQLYKGDIMNLFGVLGVVLIAVGLLGLFGIIGVTLAVAVIFCIVGVLLVLFGTGRFNSRI